MSCAEAYTVASLLMTEAFLSWFEPFHVYESEFPVGIRAGKPGAYDKRVRILIKKCQLRHQADLALQTIYKLERVGQWATGGCRTNPPSTDLGDADWRT